MANPHETETKNNTLKVLIYTLEGRWPLGHAADIPKGLTIKEVLHRASQELGLTDTSDWVARSEGKELDINQSFQHAHFSCLAEIDFQPRESGGGSHA